MESDEQYSPEFIQKKFLRSASTGLLGDLIKFHLKPYPDAKKVMDKTLIDKMNKAACVESEKQLKQQRNTSSKVPKVNELQTEMQISQLGQGAAEARVGIQEQSAEVVKPKRLAGKPDHIRVIVQTVTPPKALAPNQVEPDGKVHELLCNRNRQLRA